MREEIKHDFAFYEQYYSHPINKFIYIICIPTSCWSIFMFLNTVNYNIPLLNNSTYEIQPWISECTVSIKPSFILYTLYTLYYLYLAPCLGIISSIFYMIILYSASLFTCNIENSWQIAIVIFFLSFFLQIVGYRCIAGNRNIYSFFKQLIQSFLIGPLFIIAEIANILCCGSKCIKIEKPNIQCESITNEKNNDRYNNFNGTI